MQANNKISLNKPLSYKILCYLGYALGEEKLNFSYEKMQKTLKEIFEEYYELSTLRKEFSILKRRGSIEFATYYSKQYPILSHKGRLEIKTVLPYKRYDNWDQKWRLAIFDIPEKDRNLRLKLVGYLEGLGFGMLKDSTYLSPHPLLRAVSRHATDLGIRQHLSLMTVENILDEEKTVGKIWKLSEINRKYERFLVEAMKSQKDELWPLRVKRLENQFAQIYKIDPQLPEQYLSTDWLGNQAYSKFKELANSY